LRIKDLLGPVTRVKKKKKKTSQHQGGPPQLLQTHLPLEQREFIGHKTSIITYCSEQRVPATQTQSAAANGPMASRGAMRVRTRLGKDRAPGLARRREGGKPPGSAAAHCAGAQPRQTKTLGEAEFIAKQLTRESIDYKTSLTTY